MCLAPVHCVQLGRVDEVTLVNKEMYSSRVREFVVKGRQSHPRKDGFADYWRGLDGDAWQVMGVFVAANKKGSQTFKMSVRRRVRYALGNTCKATICLFVAWPSAARRRISSYVHQHCVVVTQFAVEKSTLYIYVDASYLYHSEQLLSSACHPQPIRLHAYKD